MELLELLKELLQPEVKLIQITTDTAKAFKSLSITEAHKGLIRLLCWKSSAMSEWPLQSLTALTKVLSVSFEF